MFVSGRTSVREMDAYAELDDRRDGAIDNSLIGVENSLLLYGKFPVPMSGEFCANLLISLFQLAPLTAKRPEKSKFRC